MFAFALWDVERRTLLVARDPLGIKPLYFARSPDVDGEWSIAFASEVRALLASGLLGKARLGPRAAASIVWNGFIVGPDTIVQGIESVSPGELKVFDRTGREEASEAYWSVPPPDAGQPLDDEALHGVLQDCLARHLRSEPRGGESIRSPWLSKRRRSTKAPLRATSPQRLAPIIRRLC
jgi:asparagine synthase (glutamine-hydrolysing)